MKKRMLLCLLGSVLIVTVVLGLCRGVKMHQLKQNPKWQLAQKLYNMENALKEFDEGWEWKSLTQVTPFYYQNAEDKVFCYYCCTTIYADDTPPENVGLNKTAFSQVVDVDLLEKKQKCEVNGFDAISGTLEGKSYLCWTISSKYSCVIEYAADTLDEADLFHMAESVSEQYDQRNTGG